MIKILLLTIFFFLLLFVESFLLRVFSFSLFIIIAISMWNRVGNLTFYIFITLFSIVLDSVLLTPLGTHGIVMGVLFLLIEFSLLLVPRDSKFGYAPVFVFVFLYYLFVIIASSLLRYRVFPEVPSSLLLQILVNSLISVGIYYLINRFVKSLRNDRTSGVIRLN